MTNFLKNAPKTSWLWMLVRFYVGYQWLNAGWHKLTGETPFSAAGMLKGAIAKAVPAAPGAKPVVQAWWASFLEGFALPNVELFNFLVMWGEILVGLALIVGFATTFALSMGAVMNLAFLLSGTTSTNPNLLGLETLLLAMPALAVGYLGVDYWFRPMFRNLINKLFHTHLDTGEHSDTPTIFRPGAAH